MQGTQTTSIFSEKELQRHSQCSLYAPKTVDLLEGPAEKTFRWALRERHIGILKSPAEIRRHFLDHWNEAWTKPKETSGYWQGPNAAPGFGRRVYEFLLKYEVLHPFEPYELRFPDGDVRGQYALVEWNKSRGEKVPMVVDLRLRRPRDIRDPYYPVLAQWLAARRAVDTVTLGIVHVPVLWGDRWVTSDINEALAAAWINAILKTASEQSVFPRAGSQCASCSHPCKEVFRGPDDNRRN